MHLDKKLDKKWRIVRLKSLIIIVKSSFVD